MAATLRALISVGLLSAAAFAQETTRVSVDSSGVEGNGNSVGGQLSADGQAVTFASLASNLVTGDSNGTWDIFVYDRSSGLVERVSVDSSGVEGDDWSSSPSLTADGQIVVFESAASNLVASDTNGAWDVFVHDRSTGVTERVSVDSSGSEANGDSHFPSISADGRFVAFQSWASNLVSPDGNGVWDVFVHDRVSGVTERVSVDSSGTEAIGVSSFPSISPDGQVVAFRSEAANLVGGDTNGFADVFVHDRATGTTERVSVDSSGAEGDDDSGIYPTALSGDGSIVAFDSVASNLVAGDTNRYPDVFVHDRGSGTTERVSVSTKGAQGYARSVWPSMTADGTLVAFFSDAKNLVAHDTNAASDVFTHDRTSGATKRVSVDSSGAEGNGWSNGSSLSADGMRAAFFGDASNLVANDTNGTGDVFVHELCSMAASWNNYGAGFPGTNGVPSFTSNQNPVLGSTVTLSLANSYGKPTVGLMFIGVQQTSIPTNRGGDLLVVPALTELLTFSYGGNSFSGTIVDDRGLCGVAVDLQAIEADPGAAKGVSFTPGLELVLGR